MMKGRIPTFIRRGICFALGNFDTPDRNFLILEALLWSFLPNRELLSYRCAILN